MPNGIFTILIMLSTPHEVHRLWRLCRESSGDSSKAIIVSPSVRLVQTFRLIHGTHERAEHARVRARAKKKTRLNVNRIIHMRATSPTLLPLLAILGGGAYTVWINCHNKRVNGLVASYCTGGIFSAPKWSEQPSSYRFSEERVKL